MINICKYLSKNRSKKLQDSIYADIIESNNPDALRNNNKLTYEQKKRLVELNPKYLLYMDNPTTDLVMKALYIDIGIARKIKNQKWFTQRVQMYIVKKEPTYLCLFEKPSEAAIREAIDIDPYTIEYIDNPTEEMQMKAINGNVWALEKIKGLKSSMTLRAIDIEPQAIVMIPDPDEKLQIEVVKKESSAIRWLENPCFEAQMISVQSAPTNIHLITDPHHLVQLKALELRWSRICLHPKFDNKSFLSIRYINKLKLIKGPLR